MLTKDLLRVSRRGGGYRLQFAGDGDRALAERGLSTYREHVGDERETLDAALETVEGDAASFKLVRGFAALCDRAATFETRAAVEPRRARRRAVAAAEDVGVVSQTERERALERAAADLGVAPDELDVALHADREARQVLAAFDPPWEATGLVAQYNLSLAQTALFDATELRVRSSDPRALVSAVKRLRLMYEIRRTDDGREVVVTGPDALFRSTRRYGTRFARLLRTVATASEWELTAAIDDRGTERELTLSDADPVRVPDAPPTAEVSFDSGVEADIATRFAALDLDWTLTREPEPLATGTRVMIPDFAIDYDHADFRVFFEVMGFWTPEYVEKKLAQLADLEDVAMIVAVDESLGVGEAIAARDHRVITYRDRVPVRELRAALRTYERELVAGAADALPDEIAPAGDVVPIAEVAGQFGASEAAIESAIESGRFPEHELVGRTLARPAALEACDDALADGMALDRASELLAEHGFADASAPLDRLGYRVEWESLAGGTIRRRDEDGE